MCDHKPREMKAQPEPDGIASDFIGPPVDRGCHRRGHAAHWGRGQCVIPAAVRAALRLNQNGAEIVHIGQGRAGDDLLINRGKEAMGIIAGQGVSRIEALRLR